MPLFLDVHTIEGGVSTDDVAGAHQKDLETQGRYGVSYLRYWVDEEAGKISVWSRPLLQRMPTPYTERRTVWSPTRSTRSASTAEKTDDLSTGTVSGPVALMVVVVASSAVREL